jgi:hypothetical protein
MVASMENQRREAIPYYWNIVTDVVRVFALYLKARILIARLSMHCFLRRVRNGEGFGPKVDSKETKGHAVSIRFPEKRMMTRGAFLGDLPRPPN